MRLTYSICYTIAFKY